MVDGWDWRALILPVMTLVLYDFGYVARMTRASMAEVMTSQYIRTAMLKGLPYRRVILRHALRNALIAPFTIIVLQLNWLLSGVVVVEVFLPICRVRQAAARRGPVRRHLRDPGCDAGRGVRGRAVADHFRRRLHVPQPAHPVQLRESASDRRRHRARRSAVALAQAAASAAARRSSRWCC